ITARTHAEAIVKAKKEGLIKSIKDVNDLDAFITNDGEAIDRFQALMRLDSAGAETMVDKGLIPKTVKPHVWTIDELKAYFPDRYAPKMPVRAREVETDCSPCP